MLWVFVFYSFYWHSRVVLQSLSCLQQMFKIVSATKWSKLILAVHMTMFTYIITALEMNLNKQCCWKQFPLILLQLYVHIGTIVTPVWIQFIGDIMVIWVASSPHCLYCQSDGGFCNPLFETEKLGKTANQQDMALSTITRGQVWTY